MPNSKRELLPTINDNILSSLKHLKPEAGDSAEVLKLKQKYLQTIINQARTYLENGSIDRVKLVHHEDWEG